MSLFNKTNTNNLSVTIAQTLFDIDMLERISLAEVVVRSRKDERKYRVYLSKYIAIIHKII